MLLQQASFVGLAPVWLAGLWRPAALPLLSPAALDVYRSALGGPPAISAHNSYYLWGTRGASGEVAITLGRDAAGYGRYYGDVRAAGRVDAPYAMPYETGLTIWVLRHPRAPLADLWSALKHYD